MKTPNRRSFPVHGHQPDESHQVKETNLLGLPRMGVYQAPDTRLDVTVTKSHCTLALSIRTLGHLHIYCGSAESSRVNSVRI